MHPDTDEQVDQYPLLEMADQRGPDPHVKMPRSMLFPQGHKDQSMFDMEEEKKEQQQPQAKRFLDSERDYKEIAEAAQLAIESNIKKYVKHHGCSDLMLAAIEQAMCGIGLYSYVNGHEDPQLRQKLLVDLKYRVTTTLDSADIHDYMGFSLHYEYERKELGYIGDSWSRLCLLVPLGNQRVYHGITSAFMVSDSNYEPNVAAFACGQLHYGPLVRAGSLMNIIKGGVAAQILPYLLSSINMSKYGMRFNPLIQQWDLSLLAQFDGIKDKQRNQSLMPFLVFTIDMPRIFVDAVCAIIRTFFQRMNTEDFYERAFEYALLKFELPESITQRVWATNQ